MIQWTAGRHALTPRARHRRIWLYLLLAAGAFVSLGLLGCGSGAQQPRAQYAEHASSGPTAPAAMHDAWQGPLPASSGAMPTSNAEMQPGAIAAPPKGRSDVTRLQRESWASGKKEKTALREPSGDETLDKVRLGSADPEHRHPSDDATRSSDGPVPRRTEDR